MPEMLNVKKVKAHHLKPRPAATTSEVHLLSLKAMRPEKLNMGGESDDQDVSDEGEPMPRTVS